MEVLDSKCDMILIRLQNQIDAKNKYQDFNQVNLMEMDSNTKMRIDEKKRREERRAN